MTRLDTFAPQEETRLYPKPWQSCKVDSHKQKHTLSHFTRGFELWTKTEYNSGPVYHQTNPIYIQKRIMS